MNLKHAVHHHLLWKKDFFLYFILVTSVCSLFYHFAPYSHPVAEMGCLIVSFLFSFGLFKPDTFSWKYFQSVPLSKRELFHFYIIDMFITFLPMFVWVFAFNDFVLELFSSGKPVLSLKSATYFIFFYIGVSFFTGVYQFYMSYESIRAPYAKVKSALIYFQNARNFLLYAFLGLLGLYALVELLIVIDDFSPELMKVIESYFFLVLLLMGAVVFYYRTFRRWMREELSYTKLNFKSFRDIPLMIALAYVITAAPNAVFDKPPVYYGESEFARKTHKKRDLLSVNFLLKNKEMLKASTTGVTPLMIAAHRGDHANFDVLEKAGIPRQGVVNFKKSYHYHGMNILMLAIEGKNIDIVKKLLETENANSKSEKFSALHLAAYRCSPEITDLLIEKGADKNSLNAKGQTPLHIASRDNCLPVVVSLLDAGADPMLKDKSGKLAKDYLRAEKDRHRIGYFIEKKMRSPAGK